MLLAAFVMTLVAGVLTTVAAIEFLADGLPTSTRTGLLFTFGVLSLLAAGVLWRGSDDVGGILAVAASIGLLVIDFQTAGLLALVGGILALATRRLTALTG